MKKDETPGYAAALEFLYGLQLFGASFGLERTRQLAALVGNPQDKLRFIHVAGTNGKGSTCAMLEGIYRASGLRVGLFTSPHLVSFRERMQVNRQLLPAADLVRLVGEIQPLLKQFPADAHPTMFEVVTVLALKYFAEQKCELVIWETGLGGRLDATNIVTPLASVITNIALDHTEWLGDTVEKIAAEKAGIIKPGVPVVSGAEQPEVRAVIARVAEQQKAPLFTVGPQSRAPLAALLESFKDVTGAAPALRLVGAHQQTNAILALATVEVLQKQLPVTAAQMRTGLAGVTWPGRLQRLERDGQKFLLDGAHNLAGVETLAEALVGLTSGETKPTLILGMLSDKDWRAMCQKLAPLAAQILLVPVGSSRTAPADQLAAVCRSTNPSARVTACASLPEALRAAVGAPLVVVAGSLYLVGEALALLDPAAADAGDERGLNDWRGAPAR